VAVMGMKRLLITLTGGDDTAESQRASRPQKI
jgi:hypothetical protein